ncbi:MAG: hypothetical protein IJV62_00045 [Eggerthellaceae bacterium]|nr:hypothetical protein [Eggerthellaceae bacterium]
MTQRTPRHRPSVARSARSNARRGKAATRTRPQSSSARTHKASSKAHYATPSIQSQPESLPQEGFTRRQLILGGAGTVALLGAGGALVNGIRSCSRDVFDENAIEVSQSDVFDLENFDEVDSDTIVEKFAELSLPYRSLIWAATDEYAACLIPSQEGQHFSQAGIIRTADASLDIVLESPISSGRGWDIYDFRCSNRGIAWLEGNNFTKKWCIYHATYIDGELGTPTLAKQGSDEYELPQIVAVEGRAFWQIMPAKNSDITDCVLESVRFGGNDIEEVIRTSRRFATPPYAATEGVVITPRSAEDSSSYKAALIDAQSLEEISSIVLPAGMAPMEVGFIGSRFAIAFDAIYAYENGFSNLGTYISEDAFDAHNNQKWFRFDRNPSAPPAWLNNMLVVKSTYAISFIDIHNKHYSTLSVPSDSDNFGDYLASSGTRLNIVTYAHIKNAEDDPHTLVRLWRPPLSPA